MYLKCKECEETHTLAKFYPRGGFISGDGAGWWVSNPEARDDLQKFFEKHDHGFDSSSFGGYQYTLEYET